jgi:hypothetical protein
MNSTSSPAQLGKNLVKPEPAPKANERDSFSFGVEGACGFTLGVGSYLLESSDSPATTQEVSTHSLKHGDEYRTRVISHMEL